MYLEREKELDCDILFQEIKKKKKGCDELRNQITLFQWNVAKINWLVKNQEKKSLNINKA